MPKKIKLMRSPVTLYTPDEFVVLDRALARYPESVRDMVKAQIMDLLPYTGTIRAAIEVLRDRYRGEMKSAEKDWRPR